MTEKGMKRVRVTQEFIQEVLKEQNEDIPNDARLITMEFDSSNLQYYCVFESEEWGERREGEFIMEL